MEAVGREDLFAEGVVGNTENYVSLVGIVRNKSVEVVETEIFGADRLEKFSETALGVGNFNADNIGHVNDLAMVGKCESCAASVVNDETEDTEALGFCDAECADVDIAVGEDLGDFIYGAGLVFGKYG